MRVRPRQCVLRPGSHEMRKPSGRVYSSAVVETGEQPSDRRVGKATRKQARAAIPRSPERPGLVSAARDKGPGGKLRVGPTASWDGEATSILGTNWRVDGRGKALREGEREKRAAKLQFDAQLSLAVAIESFTTSTKYFHACSASCLPFLPASRTLELVRVLSLVTCVLMSWYNSKPAFGPGKLHERKGATRALERVWPSSGPGPTEIGRANPGTSAS